MRKYLLAIFLVFLLHGRCSPAPGPISYSKACIYGIPVHIVTIDMSSSQVKVSPAIARHGIGATEGFGSMISRLHPTAAITGTYFCLRRLTPVGDIAIDGSVVNRGCVGTALCITPDNRVCFKSVDPGKVGDWTGFTSVLCAGPILLNGGTVSLSPASEGFHSREILRSASRAALGITNNNKLLFVSVTHRILLRQLGYIMKSIGAVDAVNLDGGSSTAFYYKGRTIVHPARRLTNLLVAYESTLDFASAKSQLAPCSMLAKQQSPATP
jgi:hypothetical protein